ncbi:MAG: NAD-dependent epimerase/dehydratase family protein, partial [bacterium]
DLQARGHRVAVLRFSNVFGATDDYHDRVVPAFAKAAARNGTLEVRGADSVFDFTALDDVVEAVMKTIDALIAGDGNLPPIDIVSGRATSLRELAAMALANGDGEIVIAPPQDFYPSRFQGDPRPAERYLGWRPGCALEERVKRLVNAFHRSEQHHSGERNENSESHSWLSALL